MMPLEAMPVIAVEAWQRVTLTEQTSPGLHSRGRCVGAVVWWKGGPTRKSRAYLGVIWEVIRPSYRLSPDLRAKAQEESNGKEE